MVRRNLRFGITALVFALLCAGIGYGVARATQPHMLNARNYLNSALSELNAATPNKGGHRKNAINLVSRAITQINLGVNYANTH